MLQCPRQPSTGARFLRRGDPYTSLSLSSNASRNRQTFMADPCGMPLSLGTAVHGGNDGDLGKKESDSPELIHALCCCGRGAEPGSRPVHGCAVGAELVIHLM